MKDLKSLITDPPKRQALIEDCVGLINAEVKSKGGLSGMAVKAGFALIKGVKPRILEDSVDGMLEEFTQELQPFYQRFQEGGSQGSMEQHLTSQAEEVADKLLGITDRRAERSKHKTMAGAYFRLRPKGKVHVAQAAPGIGRILDKHGAKI